MKSDYWDLLMLCRILDIHQEMHRTSYVFNMMWWHKHGKQVQYKTDHEMQSPLFSWQQIIQQTNILVIQLEHTTRGHQLPTFTEQYLAIWKINAFLFSHKAQCANT